MNRGLSPNSFTGQYRRWQWMTKMAGSIDSGVTGAAGEQQGSAGTFTVTVAAVKDEADGIRSFDLVLPDGGSLPAFSPGAHVDVSPPGGPVRQYSLAGDPADLSKYRLGVLLEPASRGGSAAMHKVQAGDRLAISPPRNNFPLSDAAKRHVLLAGGIGVTPLLAMVRELSRQGADWALHYCARSPERCAFKDDLAESAFATRTEFHFDGGDPSRGVDLKALLAHPAPGDHVYACGPAGFMAAVKDASAHWPAGTVHFEYFAVDPAPGDGAADESFEVEVHATGQVFQVPADKSILQVLLDNGLFVPSACTEGLCGSCLVDVLEGEPDHRDVVLTEDEHAGNKLMTVCCSRSKSPRLVIDF